MTAAEVMLLAQRGVLELDTPVSVYLDIPQVDNGMTLRHLLGHRSGVDEGRTVPLGPPDARWSTEKYLSALGAATAEPGGAFQYDTSNYVLAGAVVEKVTGKNLADSLRADLWAPLSLTRFAYQDAQELPPPLARPGQNDPLGNCAGTGDWLPCRAFSTLLGAGGAVAGDAETAARWGYDLYGARHLTADSVRQMTDFTDDDLYGLGTQDFSSGGNARWNINALGHGGEAIGYRSVLAVFPKEHVSICLLTPSSVEMLPFVQHLVKAGALT